MNVASSEINNHVNFLNSQSTSYNGCSVPCLFLPCKNLKIAMDHTSSSARQLCKSVDSDFEKLNLHTRIVPMDESPQMDCIDMTKDVAVKSEPSSVPNGVVIMRTKKQRTHLSSSRDDLTNERPMSWEDELSDGELIMKQSGANKDVIKKENRVSPMAVGDGVDNESSNRVAPSDLSVVQELNLSSIKCGSPSVSSSAEHNLSSGRNSRGESPKQQSNIYNSNIPPSPALQQRNVAFGDSVISSHGVNSSPVNLKQQSVNSRPHSSQSPSPILQQRPASSSSSSYSPSPSPQQGRHMAPAPSPSHYSLTNSPIHARYATSSESSIYSPTQSPLQSRHPFSDQPSVFSPHQSPIQPHHKNDPLYSPSQSPQMGRHPSQLIPPYSSYSYQLPQGLPHGVMPPIFPFCYPPSENSGSESKDTSTGTSPQMSPIMQSRMHDVKSNASNNSDDVLMVDRPGSSGSRHSISSFGSLEHPDLSQGIQTSGISRQQLINSPCPICGDKISGFHYGIFSCESCKGFFKRTVQNKKNYICLRGANCPVSIATRKKCPACRFEKCLRKGMKLEAIREDRTRGGRSTYQCTYSIPGQSGGVNESRGTPNYPPSTTPSDTSSVHSSISAVSDKPQSNGYSDNSVSPTNLSVPRSVPSSLSGSPTEIPVPPLINEILAVEHLWHYNTLEQGNKTDMQYNTSPPARMMASLSGAETDTDFFANLCNIADYRLYKIVKWCKSLPLFKEIIIDDQISLLINAWCELLVLSCCFRSITTPNEIKISQGKSVTLQQAQVLGLGTVIERMLNITDHFRRLKFDECEYVCLKVIILLTSDVTVLKEPHKVQHCQEQVLHAMQTYTSSHYPQTPSKFGEMLLRIPDLERTCQIGKETLFKQRTSDMPSFNLLMELLRGEH